MAIPAPLATDPPFISAADRRRLLLNAHELQTPDVLDSHVGPTASPRGGLEFLHVGVASGATIQLQIADISDAGADAVDVEFQVVDEHHRAISGVRQILVQAFNGTGSAAPTLTNAGGGGEGVLASSSTTPRGTQPDGGGDTTAKCLFNTDSTGLLTVRISHAAGTNTNCKVTARTQTPAGVGPLPLSDASCTFFVDFT